jgi:nucleotide-binding universal stress UspA family protein
MDGTESAVKAAEYAVQLARTLRCRLTAIAVVDTDTLRKLMSVRILVEQEVREFEADLEQSQRRYLGFVEQVAREAAVPVETVLRKGVCHSAVIAEQQARQADLIIVGGFRQTLTKLNLVARERQLIIDEAPCPVLVVK